MELYAVTEMDGRLVNNKLFESKAEAEEFIKYYELKDVKATALNSIYRDGKRYPILDFDKAGGKVKLAPFSIPSDVYINNESEEK